MVYKRIFMVLCYYGLSMFPMVVLWLSIVFYVFFFFLGGGGEHGLI